MVVCVIIINKKVMMKIFKSILYWVWSLTWGGIMTWLGLIIGIILTMTGHKPHRFHYNLYWTVGKNWGGLEFGAVFLIDEHNSLSTRQHEHGHGLQNLIFGPLSPLFVTIPSAFRYWFREMNSKKERLIYIFVTTLITLILGVIPIICGAVFNLTWLWVLGTVWCLYFFTVCGIWQLYELPKYDKKPEPAYDDFWIESWASQWGTKYFFE